MTKEKDRIKEIKSKFELIDDDDNLFYGRKLDRSLLLLKQIDRINFLAAVGDTGAYINSVQQLKYCLMAEIDDTAQKAIEKEQNDYDRAVNKLDQDDKAGQAQMKSELFGEIFGILNVLLRRKGLV